jgi:type IV fimbrial biogenesis protein FimT
VLTVITIVSILMALGVPSYQYVTSSNRISGEVNSLLGDLQYARAEAIKEGQTVSVCASTNLTTCSGTTLAKRLDRFLRCERQRCSRLPNDQILRVQRAFSLGDTFNANNGMKFVTFNREGFALNLNNPPITVTLHAAVPSTGSTRCLQITIVGQLTTEAAGTGACS